MSSTLPVQAQSTEQPRSFDIPAQALPSALNAFGRQSGLQVSLAAASARGVTSSAVQGTYTPAQALSLMLSGTGIPFQITADRTALIGSTESSATEIAPDGSDVLGTVVISAGNHDVTYESSGSVAYVSREEIEQRRGTSAGDFMSGIPGVMNGENRNSGALDLNVRGMQGQGRVPVIIDGATQEHTVYRGYNGAASRTYVDPDFISEVLVEKGPSTAADGTGATGGVVRMNTLGPNDILLPGRNWGFRFRGGFNTNSSSVPEPGTKGGFFGAGLYDAANLPLTFGNPDGMRRPGLLEPTGGDASLAFAWTSEKVDFVAAYAKRKNGNYHAGKHGDAANPVYTDVGGGRIQVSSAGELSRYYAQESILNTSLDNASVLLKSTIRPAEGHSIELSYMTYNSTYGEVMPTQLWRSDYYQGLLAGVDLKSASVRYNWNPADNDLINLKVDLFRTENDTRLTSSMPSSPWYFYSFDIREGIRASNTSHFVTGMGDLALTYGGTYQRDRTGMPDGFMDDANFISQLEFPPRVGSRQERSIFLNATWEPLEWLTLDGGLRRTSYNSMSEYYTLNWGQLVRGTPLYHSGRGNSASLKATIEPWEGTSFYASYTSNTRLPSLFESTSGYSIVMPNEHVGPERAYNLEIGTNLTRHGVFNEGDIARLHFAFYDLRVDNYLTRAPYRMEMFPGYYYYWTALRNLDSMKMKGIELSADYSRGAFSANLAWNHHISSNFCMTNDTTIPVEDQGCFAGGIRNSYSMHQVPPKDTVTLNLAYRLMEDKLTIGSRISYVSKRAVEGLGDGRDFSSITNQIRPGNWDAYTLVDIFASYDPNESTRIDFAIDNLTDRYYMDGLSSSLMPSPGRTIRVNVTKRF